MSQIEQASAAPPTYDVRAEFDVEATMRDGVVLRANVFRPIGDGPFPVILARTCYSKDASDEPPYWGFDPFFMARNGFIFVAQDVRGRYCSDGEFDPIVNEREDGYDSVEWAAKLPGASGRVGMVGGSYVGGTQWASAIAGAPSLKAVAPLFTWNDLLDGVMARGGAIELGLPGFWSIFQGFDRLARNYSGDELEEKFAELAEAHDTLATRGYWELPAADQPIARRLDLPTVILSDEELAKAQYTGEDFAGIATDVGSLSTGGWYDLLIQGTIDNYIINKARGRDARLIIGPWTHDEIWAHVGDMSFGVRSWREGFETDFSQSWLGRHLAFFSQHLLSDEPVQTPDKPVRIFVMGRNEWRDEDTWPLERAVDTRWYLHADQTLSPGGPDSTDTSSEFSYDPQNPVPAIGGASTWVQGHRQGPVDQAPVEGRDDVLVFTSEPLTEDLEVTGRVRAVLHALSSAPSTDWVVRLCDVDENGRSINICDGIIRVAEDADRAGDVEVDLWSTSNVFLAGHRLRVQVTSSSFPRWDRNLNTGDQSSPEMAVAQQRLYHGGEGRACFITLPIVKD